MAGLVNEVLLGVESLLSWFSLNGAIVASIVAGVFAFITKWFFEGYLALLKRLERQVSVIDAIAAELELISESAQDFSSKLSSPSAIAAYTRGAARKDYFPYIPVGQLRNIAFDLYKGEIEFLSRNATKALFASYIADDVFLACAADFRQEPFRQLSKTRKIVAIENARKAADELHDAATKCSRQLENERKSIDKFKRSRKFFFISV